MGQIRERRLVMDGSVCEDAHSFQDPNVQTAADARANGKQQCPIFSECMYGNELNRRRIRCAAIFGQKVARYALEDGHSVEVEMEAFREEAFSTSNGEIAGFAFIDPYIDPSIEITNPDKAAAAVAGWANIVLYGPTQTEQVA